MGISATLTTAFNNALENAATKVMVEADAIVDDSPSLEFKFIGFKKANCYKCCLKQAPDYLPFLMYSTCTNLGKSLGLNGDMAEQMEGVQAEVFLPMLGPWNADNSVLLRPATCDNPG